MIIKKKDSSSCRKNELEILKGFDLPWYKANLVKNEYKRFITGEKGEKNTAYHLDFYLKDNKNWMIIHDLRLEHNGQSAQIDHLIITRTLQVYVIETKAYSGNLKMNEDGSFQAIYGKDTYSIESPIEQNKRHIEILKRVFEQKEFSLKRIGLTIPFEFHNIVALDPETKFIPPKKQPTEIIKSDQLISMIKNNIDHMGAIDVLKMASKIISQKNTENFARTLTKLHKPIKHNYKERFKILDSHLIKKDAVSGTQNKPKCKCGIEMIRKDGTKGKTDFWACSKFGKRGCRKMIPIH